MKLPEDISRLLKRRFQTKPMSWLIALFENEPWSYSIDLELPTEQEAKIQPEGLPAWIMAWQSWKGAGNVVWREPRWRTIGIHRLPEKITWNHPMQIAVWLEETQIWELAQYRYQRLAQYWPPLKPHLLKYFPALSGYSETEFQYFEAAFIWLHKNPQSNLYPRQLPIIGVDSKFLEKHQKMLGKLLASVNPAVPSFTNFYQQCGLKMPPILIRMRILDKKLRANVGGLGDITTSIEALQTLKLPASQILIVENLQTGLAMSDISGTLVFMGLGYGVNLLAQIPWVAQASCYYWGDLDTHGFAMLHHLRKYFPNLQSILMDENTLLQHRALWGIEARQHAAPLLPSLTPAELGVYQGLKQQQWGMQVRLEQERIPWDFAWSALIRSIMKFSFLRK